MDISGNSTDNVHNGNTLVNGDLVVRGNIFDEGGQEGIPDVEKTDHDNLTAYAGTNPATGGVINIIDKKYILKKHGNWRIMSGLVDVTLNINGFNYFSLSFDTPPGDTIPTSTSVYLNGGMSSNPGGTSPNFLAQSAQVLSGKIIIGYITHDKALWPQSQSVPTTIKYSVSYLTTQSDPNTEILEAVPSYVENPMTEQLDANNFNIVNVNNIQASTFNGGLILTNPLTVDLGLSNNNIVNVNNIQSSSVNTNTISAISPATGINIDNNLDFKFPVNSKILNCNEMKTAGQQLRLIGGPLHLENDTAGTDILVSNPFTMNGQDIKDVADITVQSISSLGDILMNNSVDFNLQDLKRVVNINGVNGSNLNITNVDDPVVLTGSAIELRTNPPGGIVETYADIDMKGNEIKNVINISNTGNIEFTSTTGYDFKNYVDFTSKRFNTLKYIRTEADFETPSALSGIYIVVGDVTVTTQLYISGVCSIFGFNSLSKLIFDVPTIASNDYVFRNNAGSSQNLYIQDLELSKISSEGLGLCYFADNAKTNIFRISNVLFKNCDTRYTIRLVGWKLCEAINNTFVNITASVSPVSMLHLDNCNYTLVESNEFIDNVYSGQAIQILGICNYINIATNTIVTNGAGSNGLRIENSAVIERIIITDNIFNATNGALTTDLLFLDTSIHKGAICNDNTNVDPCNAALEGQVNGNTTYTATTAGVWVTIDLTGFTVGTISRFVPGLSPYSFIYDGKDPIRCLISANCQADHSTGGVDVVQFGVSQNGTVNVFVEAELSSGQASQVSLTTVVNAEFGDTFQFVCKNLTAGTNTNGFRATSLNGSLVEL